MNIKTKYDKGDELYFMLNDKICKGKVIGIKVCDTDYNFGHITPEETYAIEHEKSVWTRTNNNETVEPNEVQLLGYIQRRDVLNYPVKQNKGAPYYEVPLYSLTKFKLDPDA